MRIKKIILLEDFKKMDESLQSDLKRYIKKNKEELNSLADNEEWDSIYQLLYTEFDVIPGSTKGKELRQAFDFIF